MLHGRAENRLLPGTLAMMNEECEDGVFDIVKNKTLSDGTVIADLFFKRQNDGITDGINLTMELLGLIRSRFIGETFHNFSTSSNLCWWHTNVNLIIFSRLHIFF